MYSPAALPCRMRAAPAKNRSWSTHGGSSSAMVSATGFPVFRHSASTRSAARSSTASAIFSRARLRCAGVASRQASRAASALRSAASTSCGPDTGASA